MNNSIDKETHFLFCEKELLKTRHLHWFLSKLREKPSEDISKKILLGAERM
jgi:hypothetical protein